MNITDEDVAALRSISRVPSIAVQVPTDKMLALLDEREAMRDAQTGLAGEILTELRRARKKFPGKNVTALALMEEVGELATALFEEPRANVRKEAVQVACMAMRVVLDGDATLDDWRREKGLDALLAEQGGERDE